MKKRKTISAIITGLEGGQLFGLNEIEVSYTPSKTTFPVQKVTSSKDVSELLRTLFADSIEYRESFFCVYMNRANKVIGAFKVSTGGVTGTVVDPKLILQTALVCHACGIILTHNHPSGNTQPSEADISLTKKIQNACNFMDISLLDHLIITKESHYSFADEGKI